MSLRCIRQRKTTALIVPNIKQRRSTIKNQNCNDKVRPLVEKRKEGVYMYIYIYTGYIYLSQERKLSELIKLLKLE